MSPGRSSVSSRPSLSSPQSNTMGSPTGGMLQSPSWVLGAANVGLLGDAPISSTLGLKLRLSNGKVVA